MSMNPESGIIPYTVQSGDTLWELASDYDTTVEDIMEANPGIDPDNLQVGQVINITGSQLGIQQRRGRRPGYRYRRPYRYYGPYGPYYRPYPPYYPPYAGACPAGARPYTVQPGDSLYNIAARFGVSVDTIIASNPNVNFGLALPVGQFLCIP